MFLSLKTCDNVYNTRIYEACDASVHVAYQVQFLTATHRHINPVQVPSDPIDQIGNHSGVNFTHLK